MHWTIQLVVVLPLCSYSYASATSDVVRASFQACPSLSQCWNDYLEARKSPLWAEQFFRCGQLTTYWECAEDKQGECISSAVKYAHISQRLYAKVREECEGGTSSQIDLTSIIQLDKSKSVEMIDGDGDFPTFRFTAGHNQGSPATDVFPEHLYEDFSIVAHIRPNHEKGGMLFAITDGFRKKTIFGMEIVQEGMDQMRLNLFWTEPQHSQSQIGQSWDFKSSSDSWLRLAISVQDDTATLYTGCTQMTTKQFDRTINKLPIESSYNFYLGKGDLFGRTYQGDIQELRIVNGADEAEEYFCGMYGNLRANGLKTDNVFEGSGDPDSDDEDPQFNDFDHGEVYRIPSYDRKNKHQNNDPAGRKTLPYDYDELSDDEGFLEGSARPEYDLYKNGGISNIIVPSIITAVSEGNSMVPDDTPDMSDLVVIPSITPHDALSPPDPTVISDVDQMQSTFDDDSDWSTDSDDPYQTYQPESMDECLGEWMEWTPCDMCGNGFRNRKRTFQFGNSDRCLKAYNNGDVTDDLTEENFVDCPPRCTIGDWSVWTGCNGKCGEWAQTERVRECRDTCTDCADKCGACTCMEHLEETRFCTNMPACPTNAPLQPKLPVPRRTTSTVLPSTTSTRATTTTRKTTTTSESATTSRTPTIQLQVKFHDPVVVQQKDLHLPEDVIIPDVIMVKKEDLTHSSYQNTPVGLFDRNVGTKGDAGMDGQPGINGEPGSEGKIGQRGPTGANGVKGAMGIHGEKGEPGNDGRDGTDGTDGMNGADGINGINGEPGPSGESGAPGNTGPMGPGGPAGKDGNDGKDGLQGEPGIGGNNGQLGPPGPKGENGDQGVPGRDGLNGNLGVAGPKGEQGEDGDDGADVHPSDFWDSWKDLTDDFDDYPLSDLASRSYKKMNSEYEGSGDPSDGEQGAPGLTGAAGVPGRDGLKGEKGSDGSTGPAGPPGPAWQGIGGNVTNEEGPVGPPGMKGNKGDKGDQGDQGPLGPQGASGNPGQEGKPGYCKVLSNDDPDFKYRGDISAIEECPRGAQGEPGTTGPSGPQGPQGMRGTDGKAGEKGDAGNDGISGIPGVQGPRGIDGRNGDTGRAGNPGKDGVGTKGNHGLKGERGQPGAPGISTDGGKTVTIPGEKGEKGAGGEPGIGKEGPQGLNGNIGPEGEPGQIGMPGRPGWPGTDGSPGGRGVAGPPGEPGSVTVTNLKGVMGIPGRKGDAGTSGVDGKNGTPGRAGKDGQPGSPGPRGYEGTAGATGAPGPSGATTSDCNCDYFEHDAGQMAFVTGSEVMYIKTSAGWVPIEVGKALPVPGTDRTQPIAKTSTPAAPDRKDMEVVTTTTSTKPTTKSTTRSTTTSTKSTTTTTKKPVQAPVATTRRPRVTTRRPLPTTSEATTEGTTEAAIVKDRSCTGKRIRLVGLDVPVTGMLHGVRGLDYRCFQSAKSHRMQGTFRGFLSATVQDIYTIVRRSERTDYPICNAKDELLFNSWREMFNSDASNNGALGGKRIYTFGGRDILNDKRWRNKMIWHGSTSDGRRDPARYCDGWRSSNSNNKGLASDLRTGLLNQSSMKCSEPMAVLCVENVAREPAL